MPEKQLIVNGVTRLVWVEALGESTWRKEEHQARREGVLLRRLYYEGRQYEGENLERKREEFPGLSEGELSLKRLPEHLRKHAYSTHIEEAIDFWADQVSGNMIQKASDERVVEWMRKMWELSHATYRWQEIMSSLLVAGDLFVRLVPRPAFDPLLGEPAVRVEFWNAEDVEIDYDDDDWRSMIEVRFERFVHETIGETEQEVRYVHVFRMEPVSVVLDEAGEDVVLEEAIELVFRGDDDQPIEKRRLGLPFLPWVHMSAEQSTLMSNYGQSMISTQVMEAADRYNAVSQLEFVVLRYNSYASLAVVGDQAHLSIEQGKVVRKDVADVVTFPGGTDVFPLSLPTDTTLFEQQKQTLISSMYRGLGLERIDSDSLRGLGQLSGYALEILNRKNDGTWDRITENLREGIVAVVQMGLVIDAIVRGARFDDGVMRWWEVDVDDWWPDREVRIEFGSSYVVDDVAVRDDFGAELISRREALRLRGYDEESIDQIIEELEEDWSSADMNLMRSIQTGLPMRDEG